jgi:3-hydroxymyristoyl/3-hydroxydecanoyl-(acyl carrier protein) dehydratase
MISIPLSVPQKHRCFAGHFPGNPIVPGALLLQWMLTLVEGQLKGRGVVAVSSAKFSASLRPGDQCEVQFDYQPELSKLRVNCLLGSASACQAVLLLDAGSK